MLKLHFRRGLLQALAVLGTFALAPNALLAQRTRPPEKATVHIRSAQELEGAIGEVDRLFAAEFAKSPVGSVTIGVVSGPDLVWTKSYGMADEERKITANQDSVYRIGSITKQVTGIMLLQLVEQGKVRLSDPVEKYYPDIKRVANSFPHAPPITLRDLATHTSGLDREPGDMPTYTTGPVSAWDKTLLSAVAHTKYAYEPGTRYFYSNIGYGILGQALGNAAGAPYIRYVQQHILGPLKMTNTAFEQNDELVKKLAKGYIVADGVPDPAPSAKELRTGRGYKIPNGALFTTVRDRARFVSFEMGDGPEVVLKKTTLKENLSRAYSVDGDMKSGYGIGFMMSRKGDLISIGHGGSVAGYTAGAYFHPDTHVGIIFLRNAGRGFGNDVVMAALGALSK